MAHYTYCILSCITSRRSPPRQHHGPPQGVACSLAHVGRRSHRPPRVGVGRRRRCRRLCHRHWQADRRRRGDCCGLFGGDGSGKAEDRFGVRWLALRRSVEGWQRWLALRRRRRREEGRQSLWQEEQRIVGIEPIRRLIEEVGFRCLLYSCTHVNVNGSPRASGEK